MPNQDFNEAEQFLIRQWAPSYQLEESMASVREKYQQLCESVIEAFLEGHDDYYNARCRVIHISGNQPGTICVSKKGWPKSGKAPAGIWIENIRLEHVADEDNPAPLSSIWVRPLEDDSAERLESAKYQIAAEAQRVLSREQLAKSARGLSDIGYAIGYEFVTKHDFLETLAATDSSQFRQLLLEQLEALAKLTPILDEVLLSQRQTESK